MKFFKNSSGFSAAELLIVVAVVGVLSLAGYVVYNRQQVKTADNSYQNSQSNTAGDIPSAPAINSTDDLTKAEKTLDTVSADDSKDDSQLDAETATF